MSSIRNLCSTTRGAEAGPSFGSEGCERNLDNLIYRFDGDNPWSYFDGTPIASSVERGRKKNNAKLKKIYVRKRRKINARKNRPHKQIETMSLLCSCEKGCLLRGNAHGECREFIQNLRQDFYGKSYNEQNYILSQQMDVRVCASGLRRVTYNVSSLGTVCRGAFMKCYGFSHRKIKVLLRKMDNDGFSVQQDIRGKHKYNVTRILPESRNAVIDFICSHEASESHYRRAQTKKKYFDANLSLRKMWGKFVSKNPSFKTNRSKMKNKGPFISFSTFRNIFNEELRDVLSFRKAREDTCQYCDEVLTKIDNLLEKPNGRVTHAVE